jgi:hypothetical protein
MPRKQRSEHSPHNVIHLRLDDELHKRLKQEADRRRIPVSREIRNRLLDSFEQDTQRGYIELLVDLQICWARFRARDTSQDVAHDLARAVLADPNANSQSQILAQQIIDLRAVEQRKPSLDVS